MEDGANSQNIFGYLFEMKKQKQDCTHDFCFDNKESIELEKKSIKTKTHSCCFFKILKWQLMGGHFASSNH